MMRIVTIEMIKIDIIMKIENIENNKIMLMITIVMIITMTIVKFTVTSGTRGNSMERSTPLSLFQPLPFASPLSFPFIFPLPLPFPLPFCHLLSLPDLP